MFAPANDNALPALRPVLIVGTVGDDGAVQITDPDFWRQEPETTKGPPTPEG